MPANDYSGWIAKAKEGSLAKQNVMRPEPTLLNQINTAEASSSKRKGKNVEDIYLQAQIAESDESNIEVSVNSFQDPTTGKIFTEEFAKLKASGEVLATAVLDDQGTVLCKTYFENNEDGSPFRVLSYTQDYIDSTLVNYIEYTEFGNFNLHINL
jgi:DNA polymerase III alpha subunit (gram-positive type)